MIKVEGIRFVKFITNAIAVTNAIAMALEFLTYEMAVRHLRFAFSSVLSAKLMKACWFYFSADCPLHLLEYVSCQ